MSFFFGLASLGKTRQVISCRISFSLTIIGLKVVREFLGPADLTRAQIFSIHKFNKDYYDQ